MSEVETVEVPVCPVCGAITARTLFEGLTDRVFGVAPGRWRLVRCTSCGLARLDPRPADAAIGDLYATYYTHRPPRPYLAPTGIAGALRALRNAHLDATLGYELTPAWAVGRVAGRVLPPLAAIAERGMRSLPRGGRVLDVGSGNGLWLAEAAGAGWQAAGIDLDPAAVAAGRAAGLDLVAETIEARAEREPGSFDAVTAGHVIEHVPRPVEFLRCALALLRPGGHLWMATPNLAAIGARRWGPDWVHLDPPRHLVLFDRPSLERALASAGLVDVRRLRPTPAAGAAFAISAAVRAGVPAANGAPVSSRGLKLQGLHADLRAQRHPDLGEELLVLARKPG